MAGVPSKKKDQCHNGPKVPIPFVFLGYSFFVDWEWPKMRANDWCGQWGEESRAEQIARDRARQSDRRAKP